MTAPKTRTEKIQLLLPSVRAEGDGVYSVESLSLKGWRYLVSPKISMTAASCQCDDYAHRAPKANGPYRCIHILAVRAFYLAEKAKQTPTIGQHSAQLGAHLKTQALNRPSTVALH